MAVDWIGFAYASLLVVGGVVGYTRKGSKISLAAGLTFGSVAGYGAYCVTCDPRNVKISLCNFIFPSDHYNGNEVQEVQEVNASWTSSMPEPFDDFEACFYAAVGEFRIKYDCHYHQTDMLSILERQV
ncbi:transmembrane protein 14A isoform X1 [Sylvia atricapilla]|uniref:transmembrane protein 14A isoform X1 n=1 Tax=Sylvia atricapilla TaxID=48155 RepID=UPI003391F56A